jgi:pimeloyl-ACP methyl ester carboxylesterase
MRRPGTTTALAALISVGALAFGAAQAQAAVSTIPFTTCSDAPAYGCAHLTVPLDPSGVIPGNVTLSIRRKLAAGGAATDAVIALAGGPGQAALPFAADAAQIMEPALSTRDLVVFDQRGTGDSGPLACSALSMATAPVSTVIPACANEVGATRGLYTTDDSAYDIEQIRQALGYAKVVLYGTSYGTKVAERYAALYPQNVEGLVLDSTVVPNGPDVFDQSSYQALPRLLSQLCAAGACHGIADPEADLATVLRRLADVSVKASFYDAKGRRIRVSISPQAISQVLFTGDDDPVLRADFPAAIAAAAAHRYGLLAILVDHADIGAAHSFTQVNNPLFFDTECEELPFPWSRADAPAARRNEALAAAQALPAGSFGPFSARTAVLGGTASACAYWPFATAAAETTVTSLPNVPTLIISGADDMRTPTANADAVAAMIPDATVVVVPQTGHSVLTTELSSCAQSAVDAFFAGTTIVTACKPRSLPSYLRPAPAQPASAAADRPPPDTHGRAGHTAAAVELSLKWSSREFAESLFETLIGSFNPSFNKGLGGVYGGFARETTATKGSQKVTIRFHHFSYIAGVEITGTIASGVGTLHISGADAAAGTLTTTRANHFSGTLGGHHVHFTTSGSASALTATPRL